MGLLESLAHYLTLTGSPVSSPTAQKMLTSGTAWAEMAERSWRRGGSGMRRAPDAAGAAGAGAEP